MRVSTHRIRGRLRLPGCAATCLLLCAASPTSQASAQEANNPQRVPTGLNADSTLAVSADKSPSDSLAFPRAGPVGFDLAPPPFDGPGAPSRRPVAEVGELIGDVQDGFLYDLGSEGWPHGVSLRGADPTALGATWGGVPFQDLFTGAPRLDLLPMLHMATPAVDHGAIGRGVSIAAPLRAYDELPGPLTELYYRSSNKGLQLVRVGHAQRRRQDVLGRPGVLGLLFGYHGMGASGEYPNSGAHRGRQIFGGVRYGQIDWSLDLRLLVNRNRVGAHGGVLVPDPTDFDTIYRRIGATVRGSTARREIRRTDLSATLRTRLFGGSPTSITGFWTRHRHAFREGDTLGFFGIRTGLRVVQPVNAGALGSAAISVNAWSDGQRTLQVPTDTTAATPSFDRSAGFWQVAASDTLSGPAGKISLEAGILGIHGKAGPVVRASATTRFGRVSVEADVGSTRSGVPFAARFGAGEFVTGAGRVDAVSTTTASIRADAAWNALSLYAGGFLYSQARPVEYFATAAPDSVVAARLAGRSTRFGGTMGARLGATSGYGPYAASELTVRRAAADGGVSGQDAGAADRWKAVLPQTQVKGRLGWRRMLFMGDLDANLYLVGRTWTAFGSRVFHRPTGLLVVPATDSRSIDASWTLDIVFEGQVRTATISLSYENALAGTGVLKGNQIVPLYPLAEQRFRIGVYWPIPN